MDMSQLEINTNLQLLNSGHITKEEFDSERDLSFYRKHQKDPAPAAALAAAAAPNAMQSF